MFFKIINIESQALNCILGPIAFYVQNGFSDRSEVSTLDRNPDPVNVTKGYDVRIDCAEHRFFVVELESVTPVIVNDDESELPSNNRGMISHTY